MIPKVNINAGIANKTINARNDTSNCGIKILVALAKDTYSESNHPYILWLINNDTTSPDGLLDAIVSDSEINIILKIA